MTFLVPLHGLGPQISETWEARSSGKEKDISTTPLSMEIDVIQDKISLKIAR